MDQSSFPFKYLAINSGKGVKELVKFSDFFINNKISFTLVDLLIRALTCNVDKNNEFLFQYDPDSYIEYFYLFTKRLEILLGKRLNKNVIDGLDFHLRFGLRDLYRENEMIHYNDRKNVIWRLHELKLPINMLVISNNFYIHPI